MGKDRDKDRDRRERSRDRDRDRDRDKGKKSEKAIDPDKDPEGYRRYLEEREEKAKREAKEKQDEAKRDARLAQLKIAGTQDFKAGAQVVVVGLQKNPQKNGSVGALVKYVEDKERWAVEFANGDINNFKMENLQVMEEQEKKRCQAQRGAGRRYSVCEGLHLQHFSRDHGAESVRTFCWHRHAGERAVKKPARKEDRLRG